MTATFQEVINRLASDAWPEPLDLLRAVVAPRLSASLFPPVAAEYAVALARSSGHDPSAYLGAMLVVLAACVDDGVRLKLGPEHTEPARLWGMLIGPPGFAKTPAMRAAVRPLADVHGDWQATYAQERERYEQLLAAGEKPTKPRRRSAYTADATTEALSEVLIDNPRGVLLAAEEADAWLGMHDAYRAGGRVGPDRGAWLAAFDGGMRQIDRIKRGSVCVPNWGVSILSATTPAKLVELAPKLGVADGLFARFLPVLLAAPTTPELVDERELAGLRQAYTDRCRQLLTLAAVDSRNPVIVPLSVEAQALLWGRQKEERETLEAMQGVSEGFAAHVAKGIAHLGRIALTLHCATAHVPRACLLDLETLTKPLSMQTMSGAIDLQRQLRRHAWVTYTELLSQGPGVELVQALSRSVLANTPVPAVRRAELSKSCRAFAKASAAQRREALSRLVDAAWLRPLADGRPYGGEVSSFEVNPAIYALFAEHGVRHRALRELVQRRIILDSQG